MVLNEAKMGLIDQRTREGLFYEENSAESSIFSNTHEIVATHYLKNDCRLNTPVPLWYGQGTYPPEEAAGKKPFVFQNQDITIRESLLPDYLDSQTVYAAGLIDRSVPRFIIQRQGAEEWHAGLATGLFPIDEQCQRVDDLENPSKIFGKELRQAGAIIIAMNILSGGSDGLHGKYAKKMKSFRENNPAAYIMSELIKTADVSYIEGLYMAEGFEEGRANYIEFDERFKKNISNGTTFKSFLKGASQAKTADKAREYCHALLSKIK
jgi:hypothetical protein